MKKILTLFPVLLLSISSFCQNYLIAFAATGDTTDIESITVENLTKGTSLLLAKDELLRLSSTVDVSVDRYAEALIRIYPNPSQGISYMEFRSVNAGKVRLSLCDINGRQVSGWEGTVEEGIQKFGIRSASRGVYLLRIESGGLISMARFINSGNGGGSNEISYSGYAGELQKADKNPTDRIKGGAVERVMLYSTGDKLRYTAKSKYYFTVFADVPTGDKTVTFTFARCSDFENNRYKVVKIGTQIWMAENLKSGYYSDGAPLPYVNTVSAWDALTVSDKAFCYYDDNTANLNTYGALYTWSAAMNGAAASSTNPSNVQGACPVGWHLPSDAEWHSMILVIDPSAQYTTTESSFAGGMLKEAGNSHWAAPNTGASDYYGFRALPSGRRLETGTFSQLGYNAMWWSTSDASGNARDRTLYYTFERIDRAPAYKNVGYAIRCVKNN